MPLRDHLVTALAKELLGPRNGPYDKIEVLNGGSPYPSDEYVVDRSIDRSQGELTLRISGKNGKNKPRIIYRVGKQDKLIKDYLELCENFKDY